MDIAKQIEQTRDEISKLISKLNQLQKEAPLVPVKNYSFKDLRGEISLLELFAGQEKLLMIHNMGQGCRYCTLWADGFNGFIPHLEDACAVVLVSRDSPETQRKIANSRGWRFRMASHGGGDYIRDQSIGMKGENTMSNMPGVATYIRKGGEIFRKNIAAFGPGDLFCSQWHLLSLFGLGEDSWTPQFNYWTRPEKMDDGGQNLR